MSYLSLTFNNNFKYHTYFYANQYFKLQIDVTEYYINVFEGFNIYTLIPIL